MEKSYELRDLSWRLRGAARDAVALAYMSGQDTRCALASLDLSLVSEVEVKPGGGVRVKLADQSALLAALVEQARDADRAAGADHGGALIRALMACGDEVCGNDEDASE